MESAAIRHFSRAMLTEHALYQPFGTFVSSNVLRRLASTPVQVQVWIPILAHLDKRSTIWLEICIIFCIFSYSLLSFHPNFNMFTFAGLCTVYVAENRDALGYIVEIGLTPVKSIQDAPSNDNTIDIPSYSELISTMAEKD
jgi:hypothetical protein